MYAGPGLESLIHLRKLNEHSKSYTLHGQVLATSDGMYHSAALDCVIVEQSNDQGLTTL